jgi:hypothetical protein
LAHLLHDCLQIRGREHGRLDSRENRRLDGAARRIYDFTVQNRHDPKSVMDVLPRIAFSRVFAADQVEHLDVAKPNRFVIFRFLMDGDRLPMGCDASTSRSNRIFKLGQIFCACCHGKSASLSNKRTASNGFSFFEKSKTPCQRRGYCHAYCIAALQFTALRMLTIEL